MINKYTCESFNCYTLYMIWSLLHNNSSTNSNYMVKSLNWQIIDYVNFPFSKVALPVKCHFFYCQTCFSGTCKEIFLLKCQMTILNY